MRKILLLTVSVLLPLLITVLFIEGAAGRGAQSVGWRQSNESGFGNPDNSFATGLEAYQGYLYAGTWNSQDSADVWRTSDGKTWELFALPQIFTDTEILDAHVFGGKLYVGRGRYNAGPGGEIWRTNGTTWEKVVSGGFGNSNNSTIIAFATYSNSLYAATTNIPEGAEIWHSPTGDPGSWALAHDFGANAWAMGGLLTMEEFEGYLYVGLHRDWIGELWRTDGLTFTPVFTDGLGSPYNTSITSFAEFKGQLYIGTRNLYQGGELWGSDDGLAWTNVFTGGLGNPDNWRAYGLIVHQDQLYLVFSNEISGAEVWRSSDGESWTQIAANGWGDIANGYADYADHGAEIFQDKIYIGTRNLVDGGEIWVWSLNQLYLPIVWENHHWRKPPARRVCTCAAIP